MFRLIDTFSLEKYKYIGIVTNLIWDEIMEDGNKTLFRNLFGNLPADNLDDLLVKYTYVEDDKYYINITLQSIKVYDSSNSNEAGNYTDDRLKGHTIGIILDVNDRYSFNRIE